MMFQTEKDSVKKGKLKRFSYDGFSVFGKKKGSMALSNVVGCDCVGGRLKTGIGLKPYIFYGEEIAIDGTDGETAGVCVIDFLDGESSTDMIRKILYWSTNGKLYSTNGEDSEELFSCGKNVRICSAMDKNRETIVILVSQGGGWAITKDGWEALNALRDFFPAVCACKNRVFLVADSNVLQYSSVDDVTNFTESVDDSGRMQLPIEYGNCVALCALNDSVYVFFERGIVRLHASAAARDFKLESVAYTGGKIFGDSVGVFGDKIVYLAEDGVYVCEGLKVEKKYKKLGIKPKADGQVCNHAVCAECYLLGYKDADGAWKTAVLHKDGENGYFTGKVEGLVAFGGRAFAKADGYLQEVIDGGENSNGFFVSTEALYFGTKERKTLRKLRFNGCGRMDCTLRTDKGEKTVTLEFENGYCEYQPNERAEYFILEFSFAVGAELYEIAAEVEML